MVYEMISNSYCLSIRIISSVIITIYSYFGMNGDVISLYLTRL